MNWELLLLLIFFVILVYAGINVLIARRQDAEQASDWSFEDDSEQTPSVLRTQLTTLKLDVEPKAFILATVIFAVLVTLLFLEVFPDKFSLALLSGAGILIFSFFLLRDLAARRARRFEQELTHAIDLIHASLQGGENPIGALSIAGQASNKMVNAELLEVVRRLELGMPINQATERMNSLYGSEGVRLFTRVLHVKWLAGGDLGELLFSVNRIIRARIKFRLRVSAQLSGLKYSSVFAALVPYLVIPFFLWKNPSWLESLTQHSFGPQLLFGAILLQVVGFFWLRNILRVDH